MITLQDFQSIELRVATVRAAERVPGTEKLLRVEVDLGGERRPLVAGIAQHYAPESLIGKQIVVVANLEPAVIRGIESRGMLLAATGAAGELALITLDRPVPDGTPVR